MRRGYAGRPDENNIGLQGATNVYMGRFVSRSQPPETLARFSEQERRRQTNKLKKIN